ncbi:hypothetical protein HK099_008436 [Clydaea vesicula]|uniref:Uncharacterized protein n=1 Tax=Clydaea vesicula TaxID=447962 RepID=A0AAD5XT34_9FUNG|nr:hypothetical protein HK099_008436 [Clydaea vesicula]
MADYYVRKQDVINRGLGDVTTQTALEKLISILLKDSQDLSLITIFLGSNDAVIYPPDFNSHLVELDKYIDNLRYMIVKIRDANADTKLILISPPPVDESRERLRKNSTTVNYKNACWDISMELSVPFLDTWELFKGKANELLFTDVLVSTSFSLLDLNKRAEEYQPLLAGHDFPHLLGSERVLSWMDPTVDPCQDFYKYSCGGFEDRYREYKKTDVLELMQQSNSILMEQILMQDTDTLSTEPDDLEVFSKSKLYFESCLNVDQIEKRGVEPVLKVAEKILQDIDNNFSIPNSIAKLELQAVLTLIRVQFSKVEGHDPNDLRLQFSPAPAYKAGFDQVKEVLSVFVENDIVKIPDGYDLDSISEWVLELEKNMVSFVRSCNSGSYGNNKKNFMTLNEFNELTSMKWDDFLDEVGLNSDKIFVFGDIELWRQTFEELKEFKLKDLKFYFLWRIGVSHFNKLSKKYYEITSGVKSVKASIDDANDKMTKFQQDCVEEFGVHMNYLAAHVYVKYSFNDTQKESATEMIDELFVAFGDGLKKLKWMDHETKAVAKKKLDNIVKIVGYPDWVKDTKRIIEYYKDLEISTNYFENALNSQAHVEFAQSKKQLSSKKWIRDEFYFGFPWQLNAFHLTDYVQVQINTGILQRPLFSYRNRNSMNYGSLGMVIGHEVSHAFDSIGKSIDVHGIDATWWSKTAENNFIEATQCFSDQYSNYKVHLGENKERVLFVNGDLTLSENIADNGGLHVAYQAWKNKQKKLGQETDVELSDFDNLTDEQVFFISFAQTWCTVKEDDQTEFLIKNDPHAPNPVRVKGATRNNKEFLNAFACKRKKSEGEVCSLY